MMSTAQRQRCERERCLGFGSRFRSCLGESVSGELPVYPGLPNQLARTLDVDGSYVARILKLTTLAPDIVEALINGEEPNGLSLAKLTQTFPEEWAEQRRQFGFVTD